MATGIVVPPARAVPHRVGERIRVKGFELTEHFFTVPLDHFADACDSAETKVIEVFAREVVAASKVSDPSFDRSALPALPENFQMIRPTALAWDDRYGHAAYLDNSMPEHCWHARLRRH